MEYLLLAVCCHSGQLLYHILLLSERNADIRTLDGGRITIRLRVRQYMTDNEGHSVGCGRPLRSYFVIPISGYRYTSIDWANGSSSARFKQGLAVLAPNNRCLWPSEKLGSITAQ